MSKVQWIIPGVFKADASIVDMEIKSIGERVTPEEIVNYAKANEDSQLHRCFEWNDSVAASKYRILQAQKLLTFIIRVPESKDEPKIREYQITSERHVYKPTVMFMRNEDEYKNLLKRALAELEAFKAKYAKLIELEKVLADIEEII